MKKTFLLADDDYDDAEIFREALAEVEIPVDCMHVDTGLKVFTHLDAGHPRPDIIFLDLNMPEMNGWDCLTRLKSHTSFNDIPVIMYTTSSNQREKQIAREKGAHGFITKPSSIKEIIAILQKVAACPPSELDKHFF